MSYRRSWILLVSLLAVGASGTNCAPREGSVFQKIREQLKSEQPESDAAVILSEALDEAKGLPQERQGELLARALERAEKSRTFSPSMEAPLPDGWPKPSLPGLIRIKSYPPVRAAWVRGRSGSNGQFMTLFRHIQERQIAMTGPVVMEYKAAPDNETPKSADSMAFLYRQVGQDQKGQFGEVQVEDDQTLQVVSVGLMGSYREKNFSNAAAMLRSWLQNHPEWESAGPVRVLGYNSPFTLFWRKYSEVQIPVRAASSVK